MTELLGTTIAERYRFDLRLGEGSFAEVYRVHDTRRNVDLAAKVLRRDIAQEPSVVERFRREGEVLARLQHPNIVRYYDLIETASLVLILIEYVPGETLQSTLYHLGRPLKARETFEFLKPLTAALHFAHGEGVIHRDLKPGNILIHENGNLLVTDFGIAHILDDVTITSSLGEAVGTPLYMAPEQILNEEVTPATDVYSLGVILYQMLTGVVPFSGNHPAAQGQNASEKITFEHLHIQPAPMRTVLTDISEAIDEVVMVCLAKNPKKRPVSTRAVYDAMAEAIGAAPSTLTPLPQEVSNPPLDLRLPELSQFVKQTALDAGDTPEATMTPSIAQPALPSDSSAAETSPLNNDLIDRPTLNKNPLRAKTMESIKTVFGRTAVDTNYGAERTAPTLSVFKKVQGRQGWGMFVTLIIGLLVILGTCGLLVLYTFSDDANKRTTDNNPQFAPTITEEILEAIPSPSDLPHIGETVSPEVVSTPSISLIAYASSRNGAYNIFLTDIEGEEIRQQLTNNDNLNQTGPAWSPDGEKIAFYAYIGLNGLGDIFVMDADGSNIINVTNSLDENDRYVTWSPDGKKLAFHSNRPGEVDGSRDFELYIYSFEDDSITQITFNNVDDLGPDWSPDGKKLAFHSSENGTFRIYTISLDGTNREQITPDNLGNAYFPTWSPDGTEIAFHVDQDTTNQIFVMNADGSNLHPLMPLSGDDQFPDWSPDGINIIFQRRLENGVYGLFRYEIATETVYSVGPALGDFLPDWKP